MTDSSGCATGWWDSWVQAAKDTSASALEFVKKDLTEFTNTVQEDTTRVAANVKCKLTQENATVAGQKVKEGVSSLLGGLTKVLTIDAEDLHKPTSPQYSGPPFFDRSKARLHAIQIDPGTYTNDPTGSQEKYQDWLDTFNIEEKKGEISELLVANVQVRALYTHLVPSTQTHALFWQRYFYKVHLLAEEEALRNALMERTQETEKDTQWDEDDDWGDVTGPASPPRDSGMAKAAASVSPSVVPGTSSQDAAEIPPQPETAPRETVADKVVTVSKRDTEVVLEEKPTVVAKSSPEQPDSGHLTSGDVQDVKQEVTPAVVSVPVSHDVTPVTTGEHQDTHQHCTDVVGKDTDSSDVSQPLHVDTTTHQVEPPSQEPVDVCDSSEVRRASSGSLEVKMKVRGDLVVVGGSSSDSASPSGESINSSSNKELLEDDWEMDVEPTEKDLELMKELAAGATSPEKGDKKDDDDDADEDDWESWE